MMTSRQARPGTRVLIGICGLAVALLAATGCQAQTLGPVSNLPVPRFVSLKADKVNLRSGPTRDNDVNWVFTRAGLPVEITGESENWRKIRDSEGTEGWVYHTLLSSRRTVLVSPWSKNDKQKDMTFPLYDRDETDSAITAKLQPGVLATVKSCDGKWCRIFGEGFEGYMEQERLWGVYPNEKIK
jgi:SH3-like domain-containing protein